MRDWVERHLSTEIQEILISETDLWRVNEQSLDCQSALIHTIDEWIRVTYKADTLRELDSLVMEITSECDKADYAYSIVLDGKKAVLEQVEYSEQESVEGIKFRLKDGFLFLFASAHNLIVTRSLFDLMDGTCEDYPEKEASLILCKRENDPC